MTSLTQLFVNVAVYLPFWVALTGFQNFQEPCLDIFSSLINCFRFCSSLNSYLHLQNRLFPTHLPTSDFFHISVISKQVPSLWSLVLGQGLWSLTHCLPSCQGCSVAFLSLLVAGKILW